MIFHTSVKIYILLFLCNFLPVNIFFQMKRRLLHLFIVKSIKHFRMIMLQFLFLYLTLSNNRDVYGDDFSK